MLHPLERKAQPGHFSKAEYGPSVSGLGAVAWGDRKERTGHLTLGTVGGWRRNILSSLVSVLLTQGLREEAQGFLLPGKGTALL